MAEKHTCCAEVLRGTEWRPRKEACGCKASVERDGKWYCKRHDPVSIAEKNAERDRKWQESFNAQWKKDRLVRSAPDLLAALKLAEEYISGVGVYTCAEVCDDIRAAIRKAEGG